MSANIQHRDWTPRENQFARLGTEIRSLATGSLGMQDKISEGVVAQVESLINGLAALHLLLDMKDANGQVTSPRQREPSRGDRCGDDGSDTVSQRHHPDRRPGSRLRTED